MKTSHQIIDKKWHETTIKTCLSTQEITRKIADHLLEQWNYQVKLVYQQHKLEDTFKRKLNNL